MGEASDIGAHTTCIHSFNLTSLALLTIPVSRGYGWKLAGISAAVGMPSLAASKTNLG